MPGTEITSYKPTSRYLSARCPTGLLPNRRPSARNLVLCFLQPRLWIVSVLPRVRQIVFCFGAKKMALLYKENS